MQIVFVLLMITDLGPAFTFKYEKVVSVYTKEADCLAAVEEFKIDKSYITLKCKSETLR